MRIKIGISKSPRKRASGLSNKLGKRRVLFCLPVFFAYSIEQLLHRFFNFASMPINCNGGTEFFSILITPIVAMIIFSIFAAQVLAAFYLFTLI